MMDKPATSESTATDGRSRLERLLEELQRERDELRVRAHLLGAEVKEEWHHAEHRWEQIEPKLERLRAGTRESAQDIGAAVAQLAEEIAAAYRRVRDALR